MTVTSPIPALRRRQFKLWKAFANIVWLSGGGRMHAERRSGQRLGQRGVAILGVGPAMFLDERGATKEGVKCSDLSTAALPRSYSSQRSRWARTPSARARGCAIRLGT